jgi:hypothetical protein
MINLLDIILLGAFLSFILGGIVWGMSTRRRWERMLKGEDKEE